MHQDFYTPTEIQSKLRIARPTFYRYVKDGRLPVVRVSGALRVSEADGLATVAVGEYINGGGEAGGPGNAAICAAIHRTGAAPR